MAWTTPTTASGQVLTSSIWNASVRDNTQFLYDHTADRARAEVSHNTTQSIGNTTATNLAFNTEGADAFNMHSASGTRLTVPSGWGGWWLVSGFVSFASNATGIRNVVIQVNGSSITASLSTNAISGTDHALTVATLVRLNAADYLELNVYQSSGGALNVQAGPVFRAAWVANA